MSANNARADGLNDEVYGRMRNLKALVDLLQLASFTHEEIAHETLVSTTCMMQDQLRQLEQQLQAGGPQNAS